MPGGFDLTASHEVVGRLVPWLESCCVFFQCCRQSLLGFERVADISCGLVTHEHFLEVGFVRDLGGMTAPGEPLLAFGIAPNDENLAVVGQRVVLPEVLPRRHEPLVSGE